MGFWGFGVFMRFFFANDLLLIGFLSHKQNYFLSTSRFLALLIKKLVFFLFNHVVISCTFILDFFAHLFKASKFLEEQT